MKEFMFIIFDRYDVSKSISEVFESELSNLEDVLISKLCELWGISLEMFMEEDYKVKKSNGNVGVDCEEESYLIVEI
jgi:hypothetical protein